MSLLYLRFIYSKMVCEECSVRTMNCFFFFSFFLPRNKTPIDYFTDDIFLQYIGLTSVKTQFFFFLDVV